MSVTDSASGIPAPSTTTAPGFDPSSFNTGESMVAEGEDLATINDEFVPEGDEQPAVEEPTPWDWKAFEDQLVPVVIDGKEELVPLKEARDGYMRQADYTRKTQQTAQESQRLESVSALADAMDADFFGTVQRLYDYALEQQGIQASQGQDNPRLDPLAAEVAQLKQMFQSQAQALDDRERGQLIQAQLTSLHDELVDTYGEYNVADVARFMADHSIYDPSIATQAYLFDRSKSGVQTANELQKRAAADQQRLAAKRNAPPVRGGQNTSDNGIPLGPVEDVWDAYRRAKAQLS